MKRKPTNKLTLSKKPSLAKAPRFREAEKTLKERKSAKKTAEKGSPIKKVSNGKNPAKKAPVKKSSPKKGADPMWEHLATVMKTPK